MIQKANKSGKILIVDDNPTNVKLIKAMLSEDKYEIHGALNGSAALKTAAAILLEDYADIEPHERPYIGGQRTIGRRNQYRLVRGGKTDHYLLDPGIE